mmetsp:Transcript_23605/g.55889  ORF Transcript_23605/g.55889 Transcript_23605/m.55889 type:complete len:352 (+) Transcript_23605:66-1121(+)
MAAEEPVCMAGLPPTKELIGLKIPYGAWEPDTLITDTFGNPIFSVLDVQHHAMGSYEAIFGDENGHKLCYVKRRLITKYWKDGWDFCTYKPNFEGQPKFKERDMYGKSVYPFSFLQVRPLKCRYAYSIHKEDLGSMDTHLEAMHGWLGSMTVCCTPMIRLGKWQMDFHRPGSGDPEINIDQSKNLLEVERGNDLLAALCMAYAFDKALCQPLVTIIGYQEKEHMDDDDESLDEFDPEVLKQYPMLTNGPPGSNRNLKDYDDYDDLEQPSSYNQGYADETGGSYYDNDDGGYGDNGGYDDYYNEDGACGGGGDDNGGYGEQGDGYTYGDGEYADQGYYGEEEEQEGVFRDKS